MPAVLDFYRRALTQDGWQPDPANPSGVADPPFGDPVTLSGYHRQLGDLDVLCVVGFGDSDGVDPGAEDSEVPAGQMFYTVEAFVPGFDAEQ